jgi:hypothetical protein
MSLFVCVPPIHAIIVETKETAIHRQKLRKQIPRQRTHRQNWNSWTWNFLCGVWSIKCSTSNERKVSRFNCWWPSPRQSLWTSGLVETFDKVSFSSWTCICLGNETSSSTRGGVVLPVEVLGLLHRRFSKNLSALSQCPDCYWHYSN